MVSLGCYQGCFGNHPGYIHVSNRNINKAILTYYNKESKMFHPLISVIISLFTIFLYVALGTYVLKKNPHERTNQMFVLLMLAFVLWSVGTYNAGVAAGDASLQELLLYIKLELSGVIIAFTLFVFFAISLTKKEKAVKNPIFYIAAIPSIYLLGIIWTRDASGMELGIFSAMAGRKQEFFLFSGIFGIAGVYLLLRHYMTSKYRQHEQAKIILTGAIAAVIIAVTSNIILPMFFEIYFVPLSNLAPAVMGIFFAYAVYQYGLFIRPMPEISVTSFCGVECTLCSDYINDKCPGCRFDREKHRNCEIYLCTVKKGYKDCGECPEILTCLLRKEETSKHCFALAPKPDSSQTILKTDLKPGSTYFVKDDGYDIFLDAVKSGAYGFVASTIHPQQVKEKHGLRTTPVIWISDEAFDMGVRPGDLKRLSSIIINFMKNNNAVVLLHGIDLLISTNGFSKVQPIIQVLSSTAQTTKSCLIISTNMENEDLARLKPLFFIRHESNQQQRK